MLEVWCEVREGDKVKQMRVGSITPGKDRATLQIECPIPVGGELFIPPVCYAVNEKTQAA